MPEPFVVEIWGKPAGVVLKEGNAFRFHAFARPSSNSTVTNSARRARQDSRRRSSSRRAKASAPSDVFRLVGRLRGR